VAYNFHTEKSKIKLLMEYESVTHKVLFGNTVLAPLMSGKKYNVILQNGDCSRESTVPTLFFLNKVLYENAVSLQNSIYKRSASRQCHPTLVKAVSRDWWCCAPKRNGKTEHLAGRY
jgi:hypothetical protein